jgi:hypothetical protein
MHVIARRNSGTYHLLSIFMSPRGAAGGLIPSRAARVRVPGEIDGGSTAPARVSFYVSMCSGVQTGRIIVPTLQRGLVRLYHAATSVMPNGDHGAGGAPRQAQVFTAGRGMAAFAFPQAGKFMHSCRRENLHSCRRMWYTAPASAKIRTSDFANAPRPTSHFYARCCLFRVQLRLNLGPSNQRRKSLLQISLLF